MSVNYSTRRLTKKINRFLTNTCNIYGVGFDSKLSRLKPDFSIKILNNEFHFLNKTAQPVPVVAARHQPSSRHPCQLSSTVLVPDCPTGVHCHPSITSRVLLGVLD